MNEMKRISRPRCYTINLTFGNLENKKILVKPNANRRCKKSDIEFQIGKPLQNYCDLQDFRLRFTIEMIQ